MGMWSNGLQSRCWYRCYGPKGLEKNGRKEIGQRQERRKESGETIETALKYWTFASSNIS
jgi:hypothetical protein